MTGYNIPVYRPYLTGREVEFLTAACVSEKMSSEGAYAKGCARMLEHRLNSREILMTTSCTGALELAARVLSLGPGDEVIMPSFTFPSTANAVLLTGATPVFVEIRRDTCNIDENALAAAVTPRTKAIFIVHYGGVACEMDTLMEFAEQRSFYVVEDAAQAVAASYKGRALGTIGHLGAFSFHYTKNFQCGEGGALSVNDPALSGRAHVIREKGTNRRQFFLREVGKYSWIDIGLSSSPSELCCAFLLPQLQSIDDIILQLQDSYDRYMWGLAALQSSGDIRLPAIPTEAQSNFHLFRINVVDEQTRSALIKHLAAFGIQSTFHYAPLHLAAMGKKCRSTGELPITNEVAETLIRLPFFVGITPEQQDAVVGTVADFFGV